MSLQQVPAGRNYVECYRPVGVLQMKDESGEDAKIIAVPVTSQYRKNPISDGITQALKNCWATCQIRH